MPVCSWNKKVEENRPTFKFNFTMEFKCPGRIWTALNLSEPYVPNPLTAPFFSKFLGRILSCPDSRKISGRQISVTTSPFNKQLSRVPGKYWTIFVFVSPRLLRLTPNSLLLSPSPPQSNLRSTDGGTKSPICFFLFPYILNSSNTVLEFRYFR